MAKTFQEIVRAAADSARAGAVKVGVQHDPLGPHGAQIIEAHVVAALCSDGSPDPAPELVAVIVDAVRDALAAEDAAPAVCDWCEASPCECVRRDDESADDEPEPASVPRVEEAAPAGADPSAYAAWARDQANPVVALSPLERTKIEFDMVSALDKPVSDPGAALDIECRARLWADVARSMRPAQDLTPVPVLACFTCGPLRLATAEVTHCPRCGSPVRRGAP